MKSEKIISKNNGIRRKIIITFILKKLRREIYG